MLNKIIYICVLLFVLAACSKTKTNNENVLREDTKNESAVAAVQREPEKVEGFQEGPYDIAPVVADVLPSKLEHIEKIKWVSGVFLYPYEDTYLELTFDKKPASNEEYVKILNVSTQASKRGFVITTKEEARTILSNTIYTDTGIIGADVNLRGSVSYFTGVYFNPKGQIVDYIAKQDTAKLGLYKINLAPLPNQMFPYWFHPLIWEIGEHYIAYQEKENMFYSYALMGTLQIGNKHANDVFRISVRSFDVLFLRAPRYTIPFYPIETFIAYQKIYFDSYDDKYNPEKCDPIQVNISVWRGEPFPILKEPDGEETVVVLNRSENNLKVVGYEKERKWNEKKQGWGFWLKIRKEDSTIGRDGSGWEGWVWSNDVNEMYQPSKVNINASPEKPFVILQEPSGEITVTTVTQNESALKVIDYKTEWYEKDGRLGYWIKVKKDHLSEGRFVSNWEGWVWTGDVDIIPHRNFSGFKGMLEYYYERDSDGNIDFEPEHGRGSIDLWTNRENVAVHSEPSSESAVVRILPQDYPFSAEWRSEAREIIGTMNAYWFEAKGVGWVYGGYLE